MEFVKDQAVDPIKARVCLQAPQKQAVCEHLQAGGG